MRLALVAPGGEGMESRRALKFFGHVGIAELAFSAHKNEEKRAKWEMLSHAGKSSYSFHSLQPGTYVQPYCLRPSIVGRSDAQFMVVLEGKLALILIDQKTAIMKKVIMSASSGARAIEIPPGYYHTAIALLPNTLVLEVTEANRRAKPLPGSPKAGTLAARRLIQLWTKAPEGCFRSPWVTARR